MAVPGEKPTSIFLAFKLQKNKMLKRKKSKKEKSLIFFIELIKAHENGITIKIIADKKSNNNKYTAINYLTNHNIPVRLNGKYSIMHNKFMIIDNHSVQTGSFNYTQGASQRNAENIIYIRHKPVIAKKYLIEFDRLWKESQEAKPTY